MMAELEGDFARLRARLRMRVRERQEEMLAHTGWTTLRGRRGRRAWLRKTAAKRTEIYMPGFGVPDPFEPAGHRPSLPISNMDILVCRVVVLHWLDHLRALGGRAHAHVQAQPRWMRVAYGNASRALHASPGRWQQSKVAATRRIVADGLKLTERTIRKHERAMEAALRLHKEIGRG